MRWVLLTLCLFLAGCSSVPLVAPTTEIDVEKEAIKPQLIVNEGAVNVDTEPVAHVLSAFFIC